MPFGANCNLIRWWHFEMLCLLWCEMGSKGCRSRPLWGCIYFAFKLLNRSNSFICNPHTVQDRYLAVYTAYLTSPNGCSVVQRWLTSYLGEHLKLMHLAQPLHVPHGHATIHRRLFHQTLEHKYPSLPLIGHSKDQMLHANLPRLAPNPPPPSASNVTNTSSTGACIRT